MEMCGGWWNIQYINKAAQEPKKSAESGGAIRREFNEAYARRVERYNSMPQLNHTPSAVIHVKDDKPRSIMKRRELETREQMMYPEENRSYTRTVSNVSHKPVKTETVQRFEETRRTEEVERRVQRKERKDRRSRHHSSSRREEWAHGGQQQGESESSDEESRMRREREIHERHERELFEREARERELREIEETRRQREWAETESRSRSESRHAGVQADLVEVKRPKVIYTQRAMTQQELEEYVKNAHLAVQQANSDRSQWRSSSLSRGGYLPANESYFRQTTTKRDNSNQRGGGGWEDRMITDGSGMAHARYGSLSDSLRRGELKYVPNGEVRESHFRDGRQSGQSGQRVHKSYSTRDVFDHGAGLDRHSMHSYSGGGRRSSQAGQQPLVEFPPTLPRRGNHEMDFRPVSKSRSFADWDDQGRAGFRGHPDWAMQRRYDDDMSRLEAEFRDSHLLMPIPNGNMHERDQRTEQIPGGYETYHKDNRANSGRRVNRDGMPVDFNEASQEYSYKRETESDRRR